MSLFFPTLPMDLNRMIVSISNLETRGRLSRTSKMGQKIVLEVSPEHKVYNQLKNRTYKPIKGEPAEIKNEESPYFLSRDRTEFIFINRFAIGNFTHPDFSDQFGIKTVRIVRDRGLTFRLNYENQKIMVSKGEESWILNLPPAHDISFLSGHLLVATDEGLIAYYPPTDRKTFFYTQPFHRIYASSSEAVIYGLFSEEPYDEKRVVDTGNVRFNYEKLDLTSKDATTHLKDHPLIARFLRTKEKVATWFENFGIGFIGFFKSMLEVKKLLIACILFPPLVVAGICLIFSSSILLTLALSAAVLAVLLSIISVFYLSLGIMAGIYNASINKIN